MGSRMVVGNCFVTVLLREPIIRISRKNIAHKYVSMSASKPQMILKKNKLFLTLAFNKHRCLHMSNIGQKHSHWQTHFVLLIALQVRIPYTKSRHLIYHMHISSIIVALLNFGTRLISRIDPGLVKYTDLGYIKLLRGLTRSDSYIWAAELDRKSFCGPFY